MLEFTKSNIRMWSRLGECAVFGLAVTDVSGERSNIVALTADLCSLSCLDKFKNSYPDRFFNFGIAEQNMIAAAAGFAKEGFIPFASAQGTFASMRSADQVRVNMGYMNLGIKLVGLASGFSLGSFGPTHMGLEDIAVMRAVPNITIISPADCTATVKAVYAAASNTVPIYIRLTGTMNDPVVYNEDFNFEIGKAVTLRSGSDISIIACGSMVYNSLKAADILQEKGISVSVIDMHTIKPLDEQTLDKACGAKLVVTVEEHSIYGGLGEAVVHCLSRRELSPRQLIIGVEDFYPHANEYDNLIVECGLSSEQIAKKIFDAFSKITK